jgi:hypothetical protein
VCSWLSLEDRDAVQRLSTLFRRTVPTAENDLSVHLDLNGWGISDLTNLSRHATVTHLGLCGVHGHTNLAPLMGLQYLRVLDLSLIWRGAYYAPNFEITALASCSQLTSLDISGRSVSDLSPLANCQQLVELHTINCRGLGPLDDLLQCHRLEIFTGRWACMSAHVSVEQCDHFWAGDEHGSTFARQVSADPLQCRLQQLLQRWAHFSKIKGNTAIMNFIMDQRVNAAVVNLSAPS